MMRFAFPWSQNQRQRAGFANLRALLRLKTVGFAPRTIYDIGALQGAWSKAARRIFPRADYVLFEGNAENRNRLIESSLTHHIVVLGSEDGADRPFFMPHAAQGAGASLYRDNAVQSADADMRVEQVTTRRLDAFIAGHRLAPPDLIKLDVRGAELDVLNGAGAALAGCGALMATVALLPRNQGAPLIADVVAGIDRLGFRCADICGVRQIHGTAAQIDLLFVNAPLFDLLRRRAGLQ